MRLPAVYNIRKNNGFSVIELILVMGILTLLLSISIPPGITFYKTREFNVHKNGIVQSLRRAQLKAMSIEGDSPFGIYVSSGQRYVLFKGDSYATRDSSYDEIFDLPNNFQVLGVSEFVFSKLSGTPSNIGTTTLIADTFSEDIHINELGRINY